MVSPDNKMQLIPYLFLVSTVAAIPMGVLQQQQPSYEEEEQQHNEEESFDFIHYIDSLISNTETATAGDVDYWFEYPINENSTVTIQYDQLVNWNEHKTVHAHISVNSVDTTEMTYFNYGSNFTIASEDKLVQFNAQELTLVAEKETYTKIMSEIELDSDGFFQCSKYLEHVVSIPMQDKTLNIPLMNLSWNYYQESDDLCEPMITEGKNGNADIVLGEFVMQNLILNFQSKKLGMAVNAPGVSLI